jgi:hypothetical protein
MSRQTYPRDPIINEHSRRIVGLHGEQGLHLRAQGITLYPAPRLYVNWCVPLTSVVFFTKDIRNKGSGVCTIMSSPTLLPFSHTPIEAIEPTHARLNKSFTSFKSYPLEFRLEQLNKLYWAIKDNEQNLYDALKADFNKPQYETYMTEILWMQLTILDVMSNLRKWAADEPLEVPLTIKFVNSPRMRKEPMGVILIIGYKKLF